jgi:hypothetical protein
MHEKVLYTENELLWESTILMRLVEKFFLRLPDTLFSKNSDKYDTSKIESCGLSGGF